MGKTRVLKTHHQYDYHFLSNCLSLFLALCFSFI